jgi:hypothetical protein
MTDSHSTSEFSKYLIRTSPSEIKLNKEDIFYRDKYNEIINYIKVLAADVEYAALNKHIKLKGTLLININSGTDIIDFIKLISNNYYLELIELNISEIYRSPDTFFNNFKEILGSIGTGLEIKKNLSKKIKEQEDGTIERDTNQNKKVILINQQLDFNKMFNGKNLLENFLYIYRNNAESVNFIERNLILIWINYNFKDIIEYSENIKHFFDLLIKIPLIKSVERETFLKDFLERNQSISFDISLIIKQTDNWEINDLKHLLRIAIFKHYLNTDLNEKSNEITDVIIKLIESGEVIPSYISQISEQEDLTLSKPELQELKEKDSVQIETKKNSIENKEKIIDQIKSESLSEFLVNQLYENAASKNYNELLIIIDKLNKREALEDNDRKLLAKYPFVLNDSPNIAQINLEKAKKRVDLIKRAFGK